MTAVPAAFTGECIACLGLIRPGDLVVAVDDELVHERCEGRALIVPAPVPARPWGGDAA